MCLITSRRQQHVETNNEQKGPVSMNTRNRTFQMEKFMIFSKKQSRPIAFFRKRVYIGNTNSFPCLGGQGRSIFRQKKKRPNAV
jgi:hypothetical protein